MEARSRQQLIQQHLDEVNRLRQEELTSAAGRVAWPPQGYYLLWHVMVGVVMGGIGAAVSLGFNMIGAKLVGLHPLELIRVYLTFPMGGRALTESSDVVLTVGALLYLMTGAIYGILFHLLMSTFWREAAMGKRFFIASCIGLGLWIVNFYGLLSWLQPTLLGGNWIVTKVPFWVAAATHLLFAWTMLLVESFGKFDPAEHRA